ncbi:MAG: hypothetical protein QF921_17825 [Pseudomonadales bacterium]|jgi:hypothetical protein|nr:hypothetical protein [Pseudomonadales bacterium]MDP6470401.1 hypothetical protein [Pseudomonadales bacterium]MDP6827701.1 hypothetical protein [Pseudomonadales bacterium]MDP6973346.1 hypothetical protein [Pseudomonadales bacterium]|tara:strand:- start:151 stop:378 length:228 start_codon:yes stop_codon:yes gene_type:complete
MVTLGIRAGSGHTRHHATIGIAAHTGRVAAVTITLERDDFPILRTDGWRPPPPATGSHWNLSMLPGGRGLDRVAG